MFFINKYKVSVIIPVYNAETYLRECLDSVINQTLKDIEIICIDDGSTDESLNILNEYALKDDRIKILTQNNLYAGVARNKGLEIATGEYLSFLDADDFFEENMLEKALEKAKEDNSDIVYFDFNRYDDKNKCFKNEKTFTETLIKASPIIPSKSNLNIFNCIYPNAWSKLFKRSLVEKYNIRFEPFKTCNDISFVLSALSVANKISILDKVLVHYRTNTGKNLTAKRHKTSYLILDAIKSIEKFLLKNNLLNVYKDKLLNCFIFKIKDETRKLTDEETINFIDKFNLLFPYLILKKNNSSNTFDEIKEKENYKKVSVIIPVYNSEIYLKKCLDSVISQTLKDIEIICVDDGSTDNSLSILLEYKNLDSRIKVFAQFNNGQGSARNLALKNCVGEYIQFLDSDDWLEKDALEKLYKKAFLENIDVIHFGIKTFYAKENKFNDTIKSFSYLLNKNNLFTKEEMTKFFLKIPVSICFFYKRIILNNIKFVENLKFEDNLFLIQAFKNVNMFGVIRESLYNRTIHDNQTTNNWNIIFDDYIQIVHLIINEVRQHLFFGDNDNLIRKYINICFNRYLSLENSYQEVYKKNMENLLLEASDFIILNEEQNEFIKDLKEKNIPQTEKEIIIKEVEKPIIIEKEVIVEKEIIKEVIEEKCFMNMAITINNTNIKDLKQMFKNVIVFAFDKNCLESFVVACSSLLQKVNDKIQILCLVTPDISYDQKENIIKHFLTIKKNFVINFIDIETMINLDTNSFFEIRGITKVAYYRLFLYKILNNFDKVIYSDTDVLFLKNPFNVLDIKTNKTLMAVPAVNFIKKDYFNSGFLVIDSKKFINKSIENTLKKELQKEYKFQDQDILNYIFYNDIEKISPIYCYLPIAKQKNNYEKCLKAGVFSKKEIEDLKYPIIIHYAGKKPWQDNNVPEANTWLEYYKNLFGKDYIIKEVFKLTEKTETSNKKNITHSLISSLLGSNKLIPIYCSISYNKLNSYKITNPCIFRSEDFKTEILIFNNLNLYEKYNLMQLIELGNNTKIIYIEKYFTNGKTITVNRKLFESKVLLYSFDENINNEIIKMSNILFNEFNDVKTIEFLVDNKNVYFKRML